MTSTQDTSTDGVNALPDAASHEEHDEGKKAGSGEESGSEVAKNCRVARCKNEKDELVPCAFCCDSSIHFQCYQQKVIMDDGRKRMLSDSRRNLCATVCCYGVLRTGNALATSALKKNTDAKQEYINAIGGREEKIDYWYGEDRYGWNRS